MAERPFEFPDQEWLSVPETARWIGVPEDLLHRLAEEGAIPKPWNHGYRTVHYHREQALGLKLLIKHGWGSRLEEDGPPPTRPEKRRPSTRDDSAS